MEHMHKIRCYLPRKKMNNVDVARIFPGVRLEYLAKG